MYFIWITLVYILCGAMIMIAVVDCLWSQLDRMLCLDVISFVLHSNICVLQENVYKKQSALEQALYWLCLISAVFTFISSPATVTPSLQRPVSATCISVSHYCLFQHVVNLFDSLWPDLQKAYDYLYNKIYLTDYHKTSLRHRALGCSVPTPCECRPTTKSVTLAGCL